jgi:hypothetical protein
MAIGPGLTAVRQCCQNINVLQPKLRYVGRAQAREYGSPLGAYTSLVVTLWYRSPELLLETRAGDASVRIVGVARLLLCIRLLMLPLLL